MKRTDCIQLNIARRSAMPRGFTLIELMVVVAIVGILGMLATPMFRSLIESNRVASEINDFENDLQFARSEAIKQGVPVTVCPSSNGTSCLGANTWGAGWIAFVDPTSAGSVPSGVTPIRVRPAWVGGDTLTANPSMLRVTYNRDGFAATPGGADVKFVLSTASLNTTATRCLTLNRAGRQTVSPYKAGVCP